MISPAAGVCNRAVIMSGFYQAIYIPKSNYECLDSDRWKANVIKEAVSNGIQ
jgi:hypothetical protein